LKKYVAIIHHKKIPNIPTIPEKTCGAGNGRFNIVNKNQTNAQVQRDKNSSIINFVFIFYHEK
jgi:hypothetical protein